MGHIVPRLALQVGSVDAPLRNRLWTLVHGHFVEPAVRSFELFRSGPGDLLAEQAWDEFFKAPLDTMPRDGRFASQIREWFFEAAWFQIYDLLEWLAQEHFDARQFTRDCNAVLEAEMSGYRLVHGHVTPIVATMELEAVEAAAGQPVVAVHQHLRQALAHLSDKQSPDYRNAIKEAISAVEAAARHVADDSKATLAQALKAIDRADSLHPAMKSAFEKLYGYTSDEGGIRHALSGTTPDFEDAKFMVVACSAFANYLLGKSARRDPT